MKLKRTEQEDETTLKGNLIAIGSEVIVHSERGSLKEVEACADRLIKKHKDIILLKRKNKMITGIG